MLMPPLLQGAPVHSQCKGTSICRERIDEKRCETMVFFMSIMALGCRAFNVLLTYSIGATSVYLPMTVSKAAWMGMIAEFIKKGCIHSLTRTQKGIALSSCGLSGNNLESHNICILSLAAGDQQPCCQSFRS